MKNFIIILIAVLLMPLSSWAATSIPFTITTSEAVNVTGTPRIAVDVGGVTRYATYTSGTGTSSLTFTYTMVAGDVDLDGVTLTSPMQLNGGTIKDLNGNDATLTFTVPNTANVKVNYPSLGMDFVADADGRYTLNGTAYNDLTSFLSAAGGSFARTSIGTYYDSASTLQTAVSGTPRFDYDPSTHVAKGILIEESRTNLLLRSSEFNNVVWGTNGVSVTPSSSSAPDGSGNGALLTVTAAGGSRSISQSVAASTNLTASVWLKAASSSAASYGLYSGIDGWGAASSSTIISGPGVIAQQAGALWQISGLSAAQWTRVSITRPSSSATFYLYPNLSTQAIGNTVYAWGAQVESGAFATSYIPTVAATVTRQADDLRISVGGWFDATKGSLFASGISLVNGTGGQVLLGLGSAASTDSIDFRQTSSPTIFFMGREGGTSFDGGTGAISLNVVNKVSGSYNEGQARGFSVNGSILSAGTFGAGYGSSYARLGIGQFPDGGPNGLWNGNVQKVKYYPARITDTQLQLMTQ